jgi:hypothetical protein
MSENFDSPIEIGFCGSKQDCNVEFGINGRICKCSLQMGHSGGHVSIVNTVGPLICGQQTWDEDSGNHVCYNFPNHDGPHDENDFQWWESQSKPDHAAQVAKLQAVIAEQNAQIDVLKGEVVPGGMKKVSATISYFQKVLEDFGDSCVYFRPGGCGWGAVALNRESFDKLSEEDRAAQVHKDLLWRADWGRKRVAEIAQSFGIPNDGIYITDWWTKAKAVKTAEVELAELRKSDGSATYALGTVVGFANHACEHLPEGWTLELHLEQGSGYFDLIDPKGHTIDQEDYGSCDCELIANGMHAIEYAITAAKTEGAKL